MYTYAEKEINNKFYFFYFIHVTDNHNDHQTSYF